MKFSVSIPDDIIMLIDARASTEGVTRTEWVRQVVTLACTPTEAYLTSEEPLETSHDTFRNPTITPENPERTLQIMHLEGEVKRLGGLIDEKDQRIAHLKGISDRLLDQGERYQVLLQQQQTQAQKALSAPSTPLPASAPEPGRRPWWRIWE